jgi:hypothetical protein
VLDGARKFPRISTASTRIPPGTISPRVDVGAGDVVDLVAVRAKAIRVEVEEEIAERLRPRVFTSATTAPAMLRVSTSTRAVTS